MQPSNTPDEDPGLEGPDYVALVIEWGDDDDVVTVVSAAPPRAPGVTRTLAAVVGALGAIALASWGLHHLRDLRTA